MAKNRKNDHLNNRCLMVSKLFDNRQISTIRCVRVCTRVFMYACGAYLLGTLVVFRQSAQRLGPLFCTLCQRLGALLVRTIRRFIRENIVVVIIARIYKTDGEDGVVLSSDSEDHHKRSTLRNKESRKTRQLVSPFSKCDTVV